MDPEHAFKIVYFILFIILSAFFSSAETAFTAISRVKLRSLVEEKVKGAKLLERILKNKRDLITSILIGNNIANVAASALATAGMMDLMTVLGIENFAVAMAIITGAMTFILLAFGEITPKSIAIKNPSKFALKIRTPIYLFLLISRPAIFIFNILSSIITKLFGLDLHDVSKLLTHAEIKAIINLGEEEGVLEKEEKEMIDGVITFGDKIVREVLTPRTDVVSIDVTTDISKAVEIISTKGHSRLPIYEEDLDNIIGMIYAKDLLMVDVTDSTLKLKNFMRKAAFVPETVHIEEVLKQMRSEKFHLAIVIDEHGGLAGIVTFEDIIEEIIGEVQDEYDEEDQTFVTLSEHSFRVSASMNVNDLGRKLEIEFDNDEYDTVGGFVLSQMGTLPKQGDTFSYSDYTVLVKEIQKKRILTVDFTKLRMNSSENQEIHLDQTQGLKPTTESLH